MEVPTYKGKIEEPKAKTSNKPSFAGTAKEEARRKALKEQAEREGRPQHPVTGELGPKGYRWVGGGWQRIEALPADYDPEAPLFGSPAVELHPGFTGSRVSPATPTELVLRFATQSGAPLTSELPSEGGAEMTAAVRKELEGTRELEALGRARALYEQAKLDTAAADAKAREAAKAVEQAEIEWASASGGGVRAVLDARRQREEMDARLATARGLEKQARSELEQAHNKARLAVRAAVARAALKLRGDWIQQAADLLAEFAAEHSEQLEAIARSEARVRALHAPTSSIESSLCSGLAAELCGEQPEAPPAEKKPIPAGLIPPSYPGAHGRHPDYVDERPNK